MDSLLNECTSMLRNETLISGVFSNLRSKENVLYNKVKIQPILLKDEYKIQFIYESENKVNHENLDKEESLEKIMELANNQFKQINLFTTVEDLEVLISKKRKVKINKRKPSKAQINLSHNKVKKYILEDQVEHDFLIRLGIMDKFGKVKPSRYDKFRQINRFLELVKDIIPKLDKTREINIIDFGCGKSYLTFALYYYLVKILDLKINVIGLDLKKDVIEFCNKIALDLKYDKLRFIHGDIKDFEGIKKVDMVVTLHACDIATDAALVKAIAWNCDVILSVPCCQSELYSKIENEDFEPMLKHGIIKERLSSLITDSLRSLVLEAMGYDVQLVEFIDIENTPKNILIRGTKQGEVNKRKIEEYILFKKLWNLEELFIDKELIKIGKELR